jgi:hypothetical protein
MNPQINELIITPAMLIIPLVGVIGLMTPCYLLFWKVSRIVFQVERSKEDIDNIGKKLNTFIGQEEKYYSDFANDVRSLTEKLIRLEMSISHLDEIMHDIKKELAGAKGHTTE